MTTKTPLHQWTHTGDKVLLVRQCNKDMTAHGGFLWPTSGKVQAPDGNDKAECGGGLHGWPWGVGLGEGRDVCATDPTLVFSASPDQVISLDGKAKAVGECEVIFCGSLAKAMELTSAGRIAWIFGNSEPSSGLGASLSSSGERATLSSSGERASLSSSGYRATLSSSGLGASLSSSGERATLSSSGLGAAIAVTGGVNTIDISASSAAAICAEKFFWVVRKGAVVVQRWRDNDSGETKTAFFDSSEMDVNDGATLTIVKGEIK